MTIHFKNILLFCTLFCAALFAGCSDDKESLSPLPQEQGEVMFKFVRNNVYTVSSLEEMARIKVTLEKDGKQITLPTIDLTGDKDSLATAAIRLENGAYRVKKYLAFNNKGTQVQEAYLDEDNELLVENGRIHTFYFPVSIRIVYINNLVRNQLFGICTEVFGSDSTLWPKTWRVENEDLKTWENLEFVEDDYGNISYLSNIIFNGKFAGMKKLPAAVCQMTTLEGIQIIDLPEFEELPENMNEAGIESLSLINTGLKSFPKNFEKMPRLRSITISNSKLTSLPTRLAELKDLQYVRISGNQITEFPAELASAWQEVVSLELTHTKLNRLPDNFFHMKKVSTYVLSDNSELNSLPTTRGESTHMGGLILDRCGFTAMPAIAQTRMLSLSMENNKITTVSQEDVKKLNNQLEWLNLNGNPIKSFPAMESASLIGLSLNNCGLSDLPSLKGLPNLRALHLSKNSIPAIGSGVLAQNKLLTILDLSGNAPLKSIASDAGFALYPQKELVNGVEVTVEKPYYLSLVNVDDCPALTWQVPGNWCCIKNINVGNKDDAPLPLRSVAVYHRNTPGVTRQPCSSCGKSEYERTKTLEEYLADLKAAKK